MDTRRHHLLDDDEDLIPRREEREYTLSTGVILAIFFGLILVCGLFFAFGYNLGKKSSAASPAAPVTSSDSTDDSQFNHFNKPSAGSPAGSTAAPATTQSASVAPSSAPSSSNSGADEEPAAVEAPATPAPAAVTPVSTPRAPAARLSNASAPASAPASTPAPMPAISASGSYIVQVAAVSHREDADLLVGALRGRGYSVSARTEPQDHLLHIQVGPFASKKDAEAMRQRLLSDGYNAIVK